MVPRAGTLWKGSTLIPGAKEFIELLRYYVSTGRCNTSGWAVSPEDGLGWDMTSAWTSAFALGPLEGRER